MIIDSLTYEQKFMNENLPWCQMVVELKGLRELFLLSLLMLDNTLELTCIWHAI